MCRLEFSQKINKRAGWNKSAGWHFGVIGLLNSSITMQVLTNFLTKMFYFQPKSCLIGYFVVKNRNSSTQILCNLKNFSKLINVQDGIRVCRMENLKKLIRFAARLLERLK